MVSSTVYMAILLIFSSISHAVYNINTYKLELCGDGIVQPRLGEQCDDGNNVNGDGCSSNCTIEIPVPLIPIKNGTPSIPHPPTHRIDRRIQEQLYRS
ncbi:hypothetical protein V1517DRAFT_342179 [Lipomyces orientalis]|uniref:Uncharacterized protein n=1 Tax=Lipomyces orientalis TaxID=1233043 RepID=A0ACC3TDB5_9ASCO